MCREINHKLCRSKKRTQHNSIKLNMSAKVSSAVLDTSTVGNGNTSNTVSLSATVTTNGNSSGTGTARRLRTRTSTGSGSGNISGSDSVKKSSSLNNSNGSGGGPLTERDSNINIGGGVSGGGGGGVGGSSGPSTSSSSNTVSSTSTVNLNNDDKPNASKKYHNSCPHLSNPAVVGCARKGYAHTQPHSSSTFNMNKNEEFHFDTPLECPVFRPTQEEFKNPLAYISKIRPIAEKCGIAKILPPASWSPPFAVDVDKLRFTPRVQRLNELEAKTRVKLNFLDQIAKFWELQGSSLKIPMVERKALDLYTLHRIVQEEGGMEQMSKERKWAKVANRMSYPSSKSVGATLKAHYERILHPFEVYTSGKVLGGGGGSGGGGSAAASANVEVKLEDGKDYKVHEIPTRQQIAPPNENARRSKRFANSNASSCGLVTKTTNAVKTETKEDFKRDLLNCINSANASAAAATARGSSGVGNNNNNNNNNKKPTDSPTTNTLIDPLMKYICHICNRGDVEESMLLCDGCDDSYHTFCLLPPLSSIPKGEWLCPRCVVEEVSKPTEAFGFEQAEREYTLQQFGQMADQFKMDYFRKPVHLVPTDLVEREFWRIVSSIDEDVTVEYGADLHTMDHGSGFPTKSSLYLLPSDQEYAESSWNLNNLPLLEDSILGHINADISGMNAPWMYVGMCFAAFCWHNEDHWSYSINYLHWGEPKTWYGVPGSCAEQFEETMKQAAPELFSSQPDLLHQLVTIMNPNILMNNGVPVFRTDQNAGEFVITFPRAYHAGFNQGYNFAEAVNFAPADWLKMGRECVNHYSMLRRFCVFSHDELVCKMALEPAKLTFGIATACYIDMAEMVDSEKKLRKSLLEWGVTRAERKAFELVPDDERHCQECNTTCFLSAVSCECTKSIVCLRHYTVLCSCAPEKHTLLYRYTLDEMPLMLQKLKVKAQSFERWLSRCRDIVDANTPTSVTLAELQELCKEAEVKKFPSSLLIDRLNSAVLEAEKCVTVIQQLGINKVRTRSDNNLDAAQYKLTMEELELFVQEIDNLCCIIDEGTSVRELLVLGKQFVERANAMLKRSLNVLEEPDIESLISDGNSLRIELPQLQELLIRLKQLKWYKRSVGMRNASTKLSYADIKSLLDLANAEVLPTDPLIDKEIHKLQHIGAGIEAWEKQASKYFNTIIQRHELLDIEQFLKTATDIDGQVPSYATLKDALRKAKEWLSTVEQLQENGHFPYCHTLEAIVQRGSNIPIRIEELTRMCGHLDSAKVWKHNTARAFLKKDTFYTLLEVLMPRAEPVLIDSDLKRPFEDDFVKEMSPAQIVESVKLAEHKELREMRELRRRNMTKNPLRDDYCLCKSMFQGIMFNCQLCRDWFHDGCVPRSQNNFYPTTLQNGSNHNNSLNGCSGGGASKPKWLCPSCVRSKRPRLENILPLLVSLQTLPIRLPEDEALRCLAERAMNWQDRARKALTSPDVSAALETISAALQQQQQRRKSNVRPSNGTTNNRKAAARRNHSKNMGFTNDDDGDDDEDDDDYDDDDDDDDDEEGRLHIVEDEIEETKLSNNAGDGEDDGDFSMFGDHYSIAAQHCIELHKVLSDSETKNLEELMMEGDLLEVSLDETIELWRILSTAQPYGAMAQAVELVAQHQRHQRHNIGTQPLALALAPPPLPQQPLLSNVDSNAEDSNDSLLVQSSPNSNSNSGVSNGGSGMRNARSSPAATVIATTTTTAMTTTTTTTTVKKRRSLDPTGSNCPVPRKKNATPIKQTQTTTTTMTAGGTAAVHKKTRKSDPGRIAQSEDNNENFTPSRQSNGATNSNSNSNSQKKRKRMSNANNTSSNGNNHPSGGGSGGGNTTQAQKKNSQRSQLAQQEDDEEECRAENCAKPTGREVDWVQCDGGCNEWFHMYCVGLIRSQIKPDDDYICLNCSKKVSAHVNSVITSVSNNNNNNNNTSSTITVNNASTIAQQQLNSLSGTSGGIGGGTTVKARSQAAR